MATNTIGAASGNLLKTKMSLTEAKKFMNTKPQIHEALERNQVFMPPVSSRIVTEDWLWDVWHGRKYVPKCKDLNWRNCVRFPPKKDVFVTLELLLRRNKKDMGLTHME